MYSSATQPTRIQTRRVPAGVGSGTVNNISERDFAALSIRSPIHNDDAGTTTSITVAINNDNTGSISTNKKIISDIVSSSISQNRSDSPDRVRPKSRSHSRSRERSGGEEELSPVTSRIKSASTSRSRSAYSKSGSKTTRTRPSDGGWIDHNDDDDDSNPHGRSRVDREVSEELEEKRLQDLATSTAQRLMSSLNDPDAQLTSVNQAVTSSLHRTRTGSNSNSGSGGDDDDDDVGDILHDTSKLPAFAR